MAELKLYRIPRPNGEDAIVQLNAADAKRLPGAKEFVPNDKEERPANKAGRPANKGAGK